MLKNYPIPNTKSFQNTENAQSKAKEDTLKRLMLLRGNHGKDYKELQVN